MSNHFRPQRATDGTITARRENQAGIAEFKDYATHGAGDHYPHAAMPGVPANFAAHAGARVDAEWCVGSDPGRWDYSFAQRLLGQLRKLVARREPIIRAVPPLNHPGVFQRAELGPQAGDGCASEAERIAA